YPSARLVREVEPYAEVEAKLPALLTGDATPADTAERLIMAEMCVVNKKLNAAAVRFFRDAFAAEPKRAEELGQYRYNAACAAALAGCGLGADADKLDDAERARMRSQALEWLSAELLAWHKLAENPADHPKV